MSEPFVKMIGNHSNKMVFNAIHINSQVHSVIKMYRKKPISGAPLSNVNNVSVGADHSLDKSLFILVNDPGIK